MFFLKVLKGRIIYIVFLLQPYFTYIISYFMKNFLIHDPRYKNKDLNLFQYTKYDILIFSDVPHANDDA